MSTGKAVTELNPQRTRRVYEAGSSFCSVLVNVCGKGHGGQVYTYSRRCLLDVLYFWYHETLFFILNCFISTIPAP